MDGPLPDKYEINAGVRSRFEVECNTTNAPATVLDRKAFLGTMEQRRILYTRDQRSGQPVPPGIRYSGYTQWYSHKQLNDLQSVLISQMFAPNIHRGSYLMCRVVSRPFLSAGIHFAIEDIAGTVHKIVILHMPLDKSTSPEELDILFTIGRILIVREPFLKLSYDEDMTIVHVESPTDVMFPPVDHPLVKQVVWATELPKVPSLAMTAEDWKKIGDSCVARTRWQSAVYAYSRGLELDPSAYRIRLNRSMALSKIESFCAAWEDADRVCTELSSSKNPDPILLTKSLLRAGAAAYALQNYEAATQRFSAIQNCSPKLQQESDVYLSKIEARRREAQDGDYDWVQMYKDGQLPAPRLDVADYVSNAIKVERAPTRGGGRGVFAATHIQAGTLLLLSTPLAIVYPEDLGTTDVSVADLRTLTIRSVPRAQLATKLSAKLLENPTAYSAFQSLYAGPNIAVQKKYQFGKGRRDIQPPFTRRDPVNIDTARVEAVCYYNSMMPMLAYPPVVREGKGAYYPDAPRRSEAAALYLDMALFNHSCIGNATWICMGDAIMVRARQDIEPGEEVLIQYCCGDYYERSALLTKYFDGETDCGCATCRVDRTEDDEQRETRRDLWKDLQHQQRLIDNDQTPYSPSVALDKIQSYIPRFTATYVNKTPRGVPQIELSRAYETLYKEALKAIGSAKDATQAGEWSSVFIEAQERWLKSLGLVVRPEGKGPIIRTAPAFQELDVVTGAINMAFLYLYVLSNMPKAKKWMKSAQWVESIVVGGGVELFRERYKLLLEALHLKTLVH